MVEYDPRPPVRAAASAVYDVAAAAAVAGGGGVVFGCGNGAAACFGQNRKWYRPPGEKIVVFETFFVGI